MSAILYGNLRAEIVSDAGVRLQRVTLRQATADVLRPSQPETPRKPLMLGREQEVADAFAAIAAGRPAGFHAACGYGKTTLLENIAATVVQRRAAPACVYLRADGDRIGDLLQQLVARLYVSDQPVKLTPHECAGLLGQVSAVVALDDLRASPDQMGYLLDVLSGCSLVVGSARPVLGRRGSSYGLGGLPEETALALIAGDLGRPLTAEELAAARRLVASVAGQPLHLRQCAALAREGRHSFRSLAQQAARDPEVLDRLSINALAQHERRALAVLALAAGALLPVSVIETAGQIAYMGQWLESLRRRGLAEQRDDRFGLPVCKAESYRTMLFEDLHLAASARELSSWLTAADPTAAESQSAAEAALAIVQFAAERGDWATVVRLARAAERVLFIAGRWEAWHHALSQGLMAATTSADKAAEAFFTHQQGTLALCQDRLEDARRLLRRALTLREQIGDGLGAGVTRHNLRLLEPPQVPPPRRPRVPRRAQLIVGSVLGAMALAVGTVAIAGAMRTGQPARGQPTGRPSTPATHTTSSSPFPGQPSDSGPGQPSRPSPSQGALRFTPKTLPTATVGVADRQQIAASGGTPPYAFAVAASTLPPGLSLSTSGIISGTPTAAGSYEFTVAATDASAPTDSGSQSYTLQVAPETPRITLNPAALPPVTVGVPADQPITAAGGTAPYAFSWSGTLPPGLSLSSGGVIGGTPATAGSYQFRVTAIDSAAPPDSGSAVYTLRVAPPVTITLSPATLPDPTQCSPYEQQITATGGTAPYAFSSSGTLPPGLSLTPQGAVSGTPKEGPFASYQFTVTATDSAPSHDSGSQAYTLNVRCGG